MSWNGAPGAGPGGPSENRTARRFAWAGRRAPATAPGCHVLYLAPRGVSRLEEIFASIADAPTLTLGETREFADRGRVIHLHRIAKRITFDINHAARVAQAPRSARSCSRSDRPSTTDPPAEPSASLHRVGFRRS